jgi:hypothetical protein
MLPMSRQPPDTMGGGLLTAFSDRKRAQGYDVSGVRPLDIAENIATRLHNDRGIV